MKNKTIAVDLAKNVFQIGVSDRPGHVEKTYRLSRAKFLKFFVNREPATPADPPITGVGRYGSWDTRLF